MSACTSFWLRRVFSQACTEMPAASASATRPAATDSMEFAEDFSLGLVYLSPEGKRMTLARFNGQHDQPNDPLDLQKMHFQYHVHTATATNLNDGRYDKHPAASATRYASFQEAIIEFLATIRLDQEDIAKHFPGCEDLPLFRNQGGTA